VRRLEVADDVHLVVADDLRDAIDKPLTCNRAADLIIDLGAVGYDGSIWFWFEPS
jgi:hypothetical protein